MAKTRSTTLMNPDLRGPLLSELRRFETSPLPAELRATLSGAQAELQAAWDRIAELEKGGPKKPRTRACSTSRDPVIAEEIPASTKLWTPKGGFNRRAIAAFARRLVARGFAASYREAEKAVWADARDERADHQQACKTAMLEMLSEAAGDDDTPSMTIGTDTLFADGIDQALAA